MAEEQTEHVESVDDQPQFDPAMVQMAMQKFQSEQNLIGGALVGLAGAFVGAVIWAVITVVTEYQIGFMAIGIGFLVGIAMRSVGKGIDNVFGVVGAILALFGCALGNLLSVCYLVSVAEKMEYFEVLSRLNPEIIVELMTATFSLMDLLFYGIAVYEGYRLSFRQISEEDLARAIKGSGAAVGPT
ncbi:MAG: hypothetical protein V3U06_07075 [Candidatus Binatia bacterium]